MSENLFDYLKRYGDIPLAEKPFNPCDALILSKFVYFHFDGMVPGINDHKPFVSLRKLYTAETAELLCDDPVHTDRNKRLVRRLLSGKRFRSMKLNYYVNIVETEMETQFSALTVLLPDNTVFVGFRGTDDTYVGWKEDFNMLFMDEVPCQKYAVKYVNCIGGLLRQDFIVGGHSKGGNIAMYSGMCCAEEIRKRIRKIYSFDGPSYRDEVLQRLNFSAVADRVEKYIPAGSFIGMLLEKGSDYTIIKSSAHGGGIFQHNLYTWVIEDDHFVLEEDLTGHAVRVDDTINGWIWSQDEEHRKEFINTMYELLLDSSGVQSFRDFSADKWGNMNRLITSLREVDEETATMLRKIMKALFDVAGERIKREASESGHQLKESMAKAGKKMGESMTATGKKMGESMTATGKKMGESMTATGKKMSESMTATGKKMSESMSATSKKVGESVSATVQKGIEKVEKLFDKKETESGEEPLLLPDGKEAEPMNGSPEDS